MDDLKLTFGRLGVEARRDTVEVWALSSGSKWRFETLTHAEVVRLHAWLAGWLAEHQPESETREEQTR